MGNAVKIHLLAPPTPLNDFDPGQYLSELEFYETDDLITDKDRDGLAQFAHLLAFMALQAKSSKWDGSTVRHGSLAYQALESHFGHLEGWNELSAGDRDLLYRQLAWFLMRHYPPHLPAGQGAEPAANCGGM